MIPRRFFWLLDFAMVAFAFTLAYATWPWARAAAPALQWLPETLRPAATSGELPPFASMLRVMVLGGLASIVGLELSRGYSPLLQLTRTRVLFCSVVAAVGSASAITFFLFIEKQIGWSRAFLLSYLAFTAAVLFLFRMSLRHYFRQRRQAGFYTKRVLVVGPVESVRWLVDYFRAHIPPTEYVVTAYLSTPAEQLDGETGCTLLGRSDQIGDVLMSKPVDEVIAVQPSSGAPWLDTVIESCDALGILLRIVPQGLLVVGKLQTLRPKQPYPALDLPSIVLTPIHFDSDALFFKRLFDITTSAALLVLLSPLFAIIAAIIKLSDRRSPILYRWNVVGRNGARFTGYKFTTMYSDADERRKELLDKNEMSGPVFKIKNDPRVTPVGRFLRKFSLNELPQLWSVLKGDMSLVGPRPAFPHELDGYGFWHKRKLSIRPGITCLWQVRGRNKISSFDDWVKMDLEYIDHWSLWLDFKILVRTAWAVVAGTGS